MKNVPPFEQHSEHLLVLLKRSRLLDRGGSDCWRALNQEIRSQVSMLSKAISNLNHAEKCTHLHELTQRIFRLALDTTHIARVLQPLYAGFGLTPADMRAYRLSIATPFATGSESARRL